MPSPNTIKLNEERAKLRLGSITVHPPTPGLSRDFLRKRAREHYKELGLSWDEFKLEVRKNGGLRALAKE